MPKLKTVEQLTKDLQDTIRKLYSRLEGTEEEKRQAIETEVKKSINEATKRSSKGSSRSKVSNEDFIQAAKEDPNLERLTKKFEYKSIEVVRFKMRNLGITTDFAIARMIRENPKRSNEEIAAEANVELKAVEKIREGIKIGTILNSGAKVSDETFEKAAKVDPNVKRLAEKFEYRNPTTVSTKMRNLGIATDVAIVRMMRENPKRSNEEISAEANVDVETVEKIREDFKKGKIILGRGRKARYSDEDFVKAAKEDPNTKRLAKKFEYSTPATVAQRMRDLGIATDYKIAIIIKQNPKRSNKEIAAEVNVDVEAIEKIREGIKTKPVKKDSRKKISDKDFIQAAKVDPNAERLAKKFEYKSIAGVRTKMRNLGITVDFDIARMMRENPEKSDEEIAAEANVDVEAVRKIREENADKKKKKISNSVKSRRSKSAIKKDKESIKPAQTPQGRVAGSVDSPRYTENTSRTEIPQRTFTSQVEHRDIDTVSQRRQEIAKAIRQSSMDPKQRRIYEMGMKLEPEEKIAGATGMSKYEVILLLRKQGIASRSEVERWMESTEMTDEEITAKSVGELNTVIQIRKMLIKREAMIQRIPEPIKRNIISALTSNNGHISIPYVSKKYNVGDGQIEALAEKWERDRDIITDESKIRPYIDREINSIRGLTSKDRVSINIKATKLRALYDQYLTRAEHALIAYKYYQAGEYLKAIEIGETHLGLEDFTLEELVTKIRQVVDEEREKSGIRLRDIDER